MEKIIQKLSNQNKLILGFIAASALWLLLSIPTHAATINVAAVTDGFDADGVCQLTEAIANINNQDGSEADCTAADGVNDTINIAAGTILLTASIPIINEPVSIQGAGMNQTIIDGNSGQYRGFTVIYSNTNDDVAIKGLKIRAFSYAAIDVNSASLNMQEVDIDGTNANSNLGFAVKYINATSGTADVLVRNVHIHNISVSEANFHNFIISGYVSGGTINATVSNITINDIVNTGGINNLAFTVGAYDAFGGEHTINATVDNATIYNISAGSLSSMILALSFAEGNDNNVTVAITNSTLVNPLSSTGDGVISAGAGLTPGVNATSSITTKNVLISQATTNCTTLDYGPLVGGTGTSTPTITSAGGNISDDTTCSPYFTDTKDQNNISSLFSTLGSLSDNGGFVPTIPLLANSPAVDGGVAVAGLITDARGTARPQGSGYDIGAYEIVSNATTNPDPSNPEVTNPTAGSSTLASTGENTPMTIMAGVVTILFSLGGLVIMRKQRV